MYNKFVTYYKNNRQMIHSSIIIFFLFTFYQIKQIIHLSQPIIFTNMHQSISIYFYLTILLLLPLYLFLFIYQPSLMIVHISFSLNISVNVNNVYRQTKIKNYFIDYSIHDNRYFAKLVVNRCWKYLLIYKN